MTKGRAVAPPGIGCIMGVSISTNPREVRNSRTNRMIRLRRRNVSRTSGFMIRSTYRCRYRVSLSVSPCHFSGRGRRLLASSRTSRASTVSSPVRVRMRGPVAPRKSPTSSFRNQA